MTLSAPVSLSAAQSTSQRSGWPTAGTRAMWPVDSNRSAGAAGGCPVPSCCARRLGRFPLIEGEWVRARLRLRASRMARCSCSSQANRPTPCDQRTLERLRNTDTCCACGFPARRQRYWRCARRGGASLHNAGAELRGLTGGCACRVVFLSTATSLPGESPLGLRFCCQG
jgi:hypothetical protein